LDWLTVKTTELETAQASTSQSKNNGREQAYIVLLGHSMGGLVIADAALKLIRERDAGTALQETITWPGIIGLVGYDTPYYGLNPTLFTNTANEYLAHVKTAQQVMNNLGFGLGLGSMQGAASSSSSSRAGPSGGSKTTPEKPAEKKTTTTTPPTNAANNNWMKLGLAAIGVASLAAGTTYWQKDKITENVGWATSHLDYVKELFETDRLNQRMTDIMQIHPVVNFHCFYTEIPKLDAKTTDRHFISLPNSKTLPTGIDALFTANRNQKASNEIVAHTSMFSQNMNSGYWDLGKDSGRLITEWLQGSYQRRWKLKQSMADAGLGDKPSCTRSTQDPTIRDQLSREAQVNLDAQVGDQVLPLHEEL